MKKSNNNSGRTFATRAKRFFKHYFGLLVLALICAAAMTVVLFCAMGSI